MMGGERERGEIEWERSIQCIISCVCNTWTLPLHLPIGFLLSLVSLLALF